MLFSVHIPKTGGTTFQYGVLERMFGDKLIYDTEENAYGDKSNIDFDKGSINKAECLHGHYLPAKYKHRLGQDRFSIWVRHPVARSRSLYGVTNLRKGWRSLDEFCEQEINHNTMTRFMEGMSFDDFDFVGVTEHYDRSLKAFNKLYPNAPTDPEPLRVFNPSGKVDNVYVLTRREYSMLEAINEKDLETYELGVKRFEEIAA